MKKILNNAAGAAILKRPNRAADSKASAFLNSITRAGTNKFSGVRDFCEAYAVTQDTFTRLAGFSPRAVANWAQGQKPSASTERRLNELRRLFEALEQLVKAEAIGPWLKEPNPAFDGSTPVQVIERGDTDRIWRMIYELQSGEPG
jgi:DNA-binding transcriptional regulator YiaG